MSNGRRLHQTSNKLFTETAFRINVLPIKQISGYFFESLHDKFEVIAD